jgi:hypothetical protein
MDQIDSATENQMAAVQDNVISMCIFNFLNQVPGSYLTRLDGNRLRRNPLSALNRNRDLVIRSQVT